MAKKQQQSVKVNIPKLIEIHNKNNPDDQVDRKGLAKLGNTSYQTLTNFNNGVTGKGMNLLHKLLEISGAKYEEVTETKDI